MQNTKGLPWIFSPSYIQAHLRLTAEGRKALFVQKLQICGNRHLIFHVVLFALFTIALFLVGSIVQGDQSGLNTTSLKWQT